MPAVSDPPAAYRAALERLYARRRFGLRPGLEVIGGLLEQLGHPERKWRAIHVTGSKGKGSVATMAAAVLSATVGPTGLYTSPHLQSYRERIRVDGTPIGTEETVAGLARVEGAAAVLARERPELHAPTFFEVTTALAFDFFAREKVAAAVVEVGIGGRWDATNVIHAPVGVITSVELEHTEILGPTLTHIAQEKAGILHAGAYAIVGERKGEPVAAIAREADRLGVPLWSLGQHIRVSNRRLLRVGQQLDVELPSGRYERLRLPLDGPVQASNAALALAAAERFLATVGKPLDEASCRRALKELSWRGRLEKIPGRPELYADVAHTPESVRAVVAALAERRPLLDPAENAVLFGCVQDKAAAAMLESLRGIAEALVLVPVRSERSRNPRDLRLDSAGRFPRTVLARSVEEGLPLLRAAVGAGGFGLVVGSDYLVGEVLDRIEGRTAGEPDLSDPMLAAPGLEAPARAGR
ncbi:MAG: bifunctional folylpolyglutamate synthase/dihydrofolate synthase [Thermoplasmata archaeon]|nr:bifunctional folylpolyglutamate synthase/dihydrofolate synthase [Thermoplasmata archaeon]